VPVPPWDGAAAAEAADEDGTPRPPCAAEAEAAEAADGTARQARRALMDLAQADAAGSLACWFPVLDASAAGASGDSLHVAAAIESAAAAEAVPSKAILRAALLINQSMRISDATQRRTGPTGLVAPITTSPTQFQASDACGALFLALRRPVLVNGAERGGEDEAGAAAATAATGADDGAPADSGSYDGRAFALGLAVLRRLVIKPSFVDESLLVTEGNHPQSDLFKIRWGVVRACREAGACLPLLRRIPVSPKMLDFAAQLMARVSNGKNGRLAARTLVPALAAWALPEGLGFRF